MKSLSWISKLTLHTGKRFLLSFILVASPLASRGEAIRIIGKSPSYVESFALNLYKKREKNRSTLYYGLRGQEYSIKPS